MGAILEVVATLVAAGVMSVAPVLVKYLVKFIGGSQQITSVLIKDSSGRTEVIELKERMSHEEIQQASNKLSAAIQAGEDKREEE